MVKATANSLSLPLVCVLRGFSSAKVKVPELLEENSPKERERERERKKNREKFENERAKRGHSNNGNLLSLSLSPLLPSPT